MSPVKYGTTTYFVQSLLPGAQDMRIMLLLEALLATFHHCVLVLAGKHQLSDATIYAKGGQTST